MNKIVKLINFYIKYGIIFFIMYGYQATADPGIVSQVAKRRTHLISCNEDDDDLLLTDDTESIKTKLEQPTPIVEPKLIKTPPPVKPRAKPPLPVEDKPINSNPSITLRSRLWKRKPKVVFIQDSIYEQQPKSPKPINTVSSINQIAKLINGLQIKITTQETQLADMRKDLEKITNLVNFGTLYS